MRFAPRRSASAAPGGGSEGAVSGVSRLGPCCLGGLRGGGLSLVGSPLPFDPVSPGEPGGARWPASAGSPAAGPVHGAVASELGVLRDFLDHRLRLLEARLLLSGRELADKHAAAILEAVSSAGRAAPQAEPPRRHAERRVSRRLSRGSHVRGPSPERDGLDDDLVDGPGAWAAAGALRLPGVRGRPARLSSPAASGEEGPHPAAADPAEPPRGLAEGAAPPWVSRERSSGGLSGRAVSFEIWPEGGCEDGSSPAKQVSKRITSKRPAVQRHRCSSEELTLGNSHSSPSVSTPSRTPRPTRTTSRSNAAEHPSVMSWVRDIGRDHSFRYIPFAAWLRYVPGKVQIESWIEWYASLEEPSRSGMLHAVVASWQFNLMCQLVILLNTGFVFADTNYMIENMQEQGMPASTAMEIFFCIFYTVELALRFLAQGRWFFIGNDASWNCFDTCLVLVTFLDIIGSLAGNVGYTRVFRILKIVKILRVVRVLQFFNELRLMINCVLGSIVSLFWCIVMIYFVMFLFAVYFTQEVTRHMQDKGPADVELSDFPDIEVFFDSVQTTTLTLFMAVTGGEDWRRIYEVLQQVGEMACLGFLSYIFIFLFSVLNVIMGIFVEKAVKLAQPDSDSLLIQSRRRRAADAKELVTLFANADLDGSKTLSQEEFEAFISQPEFKEFLQMRGIDIKEARTFFNMVAETMGDRELEVNHVVRCCLGIKGYATSIDLHILRYEVRQALSMLEDLTERLDDDGSTVGGEVSRSSSFVDQGAAAAAPREPV